MGEALEAAINHSKAILILIGTHGLGNTQQYERQYALFRQSREHAFPVIPVLLPGVSSTLRISPTADLDRLLTLWKGQRRSRRAATFVDRRRAERSIRNAPGDDLSLSVGSTHSARKTRLSFSGAAAPTTRTTPIGAAHPETPRAPVCHRGGSIRQRRVVAGARRADAGSAARAGQILDRGVSVRPGSDAPCARRRRAFQPARRKTKLAEYAMKITTRGRMR